MIGWIEVRLAYRGEAKAWKVHPQEPFADELVGLGWLDEALRSPSSVVDEPPFQIAFAELPKKRHRRSAARGTRR
jgi:hypothetical protein